MRCALRAPAGFVLTFVLALGFSGCQGGGGPSSITPPDDPDIPAGPHVTAVSPSRFAPGATIELSGTQFPADSRQIRIAFNRIGESPSSGILGLPFRLTRSLVTAIVPAGAPSGTLIMSVLSKGAFQALEPMQVTVAPQVTGFLVPNAPRIPGVLEGDFLRGVVPSQVIVYGFNIDAGTQAATIDLISPPRRTSERISDVSIPPGDRGIPVPGVSDSAIRGVRVTLPKSIGQKLLEDDVLYFVRIMLRAESSLSNAIEIPAMKAGSELGGQYTAPFPALISGASTSPGVQGNLLELFYTAYQPVVALKWAPILEWTPDEGKTWTALADSTIEIPREGTFDPVDFRRSFIIAGTGVQTPERQTMAGPGSTYRLYINIAKAWPPDTFDSVSRGGQIRLRMRMASEPQSHGESPVDLAGRIEGNVMELPFAAVAYANEPSTGEPVTGGVIIEEFESKDRFLEKDRYTDFDSTGRWGVGTPGVATGTLALPPVTGSGTHDLDLLQDRSYLFDTDLGGLYLFPEGASEAFIDTVRAELGRDPTRRSHTAGENLTLGMDQAQNPGARYGELHVARLSMPAGTAIYARGTRPFIIRARAEPGTVAVIIDGAIIVDGLPGGDGISDDDVPTGAARGAGGIGGPGGGNGGRGGVVHVGLVGTAEGPIEALPAEAGYRGGGAGQTMAYTPSLGTTDEPAKRPSFVYGGAGGGGGLETSGAVGRAGDRTDGTNAITWTPQQVNPWISFGPIIRVDGIGGPRNGSADLLPLTPGTGGGGGGGFLARRIEGSSTSIFGVGGGGGGGGGGAFQLVAQGIIELRGFISARGGAGGVGRGKPLAPAGTARMRGDWSGSCGGGGSGGAILVQATDRIIVSAGAELDVTGGLGGRPGETTDQQFLDSPHYPIGGDGGRGRIRLEATAPVTIGDLARLVLHPAGILPSLGSPFTGEEVVSHVWSNPSPLSGGPADGLMLTDAIANIGSALVTLTGVDFTSPVVRWNVLVDGGEARCGPRPEPDRLFGPSEIFNTLIEVGLKPSYLRFMIVFVGSAETGELIEVDDIEIPWDRVEYP